MISLPPASGPRAGRNPRAPRHIKRLGHGAVGRCTHGSQRKPPCLIDHPVAHESLTTVLVHPTAARPGRRVQALQHMVGAQGGGANGLRSTNLISRTFSFQWICYPHGRGKGAAVTSSRTAPMDSRSQWARSQWQWTDETGRHSGGTGKRVLVVGEPVAQTKCLLWTLSVIRTN